MCEVQSLRCEPATSLPQCRVTGAGECVLGTPRPVGHRVSCPATYDCSGELGLLDKLVGFLNSVPHLPGSQPSVTALVAHWGRRCDPGLPGKRQESYCELWNKQGISWHLSQQSDQTLPAPREVSNLSDLPEHFTRDQAARFWIIFAHLSS